MICGQSTEFKNILEKFDNLESQITGGLETSASALAANLNVDLNLLDLDVQKMIPALPTVDGLSLPDQMNNLLSMGAGSLDYTSQLASITKNFGPSLTAAGYSLDSIVSEATSALGGGLDICGSIPNMNLPAGATDAIEEAKKALEPTVDSLSETISEVATSTEMDNLKKSLEDTAAKWKSESGSIPSALKEAKETIQVAYESGTKDVATPKTMVTKSDAGKASSRSNFNSKGVATQRVLVHMTFKTGGEEKVSMPNWPEITLDHEPLKVVSIRVVERVDRPGKTFEGRRITDYSISGKTLFLGDLNPVDKFHSVSVIYWGLDTVDSRWA